MYICLPDIKKNNQSTIHFNQICWIWSKFSHSQGMHIHMNSCDTLKNILSANQLFSFFDMKRKFINSDNHKFHQYQ